MLWIMDTDDSTGITVKIYHWIIRMTAGAMLSFILEKELLKNLNSPYAAFSSPGGPLNN